jgi:hypothetical protein
MYGEIYRKYSLFYKGTYAELYDCSIEIPHLAIGVWRGFFKLEDRKFIDEMYLSLSFIKQRQIIAIISDHSALRVVNRDVLNWLQSNWYPLAAKYGLRIEAALDAECPFGRLSLKRMLGEAKTEKVNTPLFPDFNSAHAFCAEFIGKYKNEGSCRVSRT